MSEQHIRQQLLNLLLERQAHLIFEDAVKDFPLAYINTKPSNLDYSFWHLLEHIRFCQWDIVDYIRNPHYQSHQWPRDYWRPRDEQADAQVWQQTIEQFLADRTALVEIINNPETDLYQPIPHGWDGHTIFREVMVVASHNAYHIGEFASWRGIMGLW